jgi:chorismate dehydratase
MRVGAVTYLNTKPLVYQLDRLLPAARVEYDLPSRLADRLAAAELDVALVPVFEAFQHPEWVFVSDACIACRGPVLSVKLLSRRPLPSVRRVALDDGSRTSAALVQILLAKRAGLSPEYVSLPIGADIQQVDADAVLVIGDRAIQTSESDFVEVWDLGDDWNRWTELPFVFACWMAAPGWDVTGVERALAEARDAGVLNAAALARLHAGYAGLTEVQCRDYFQRHLHFYFGPRERLGLKLFYRYARELNLAPAGWELPSDDCQTVG